MEPPAVRERMQAADLYPDALPCLRRAQDCGFIIGIAGNQPEEAVGELAALALECDFIASSGGWSVEKPSSLFFERVIDAAGVDAGMILYEGDRLDNDVVPARRAGGARCSSDARTVGAHHDRSVPLRGRGPPSPIAGTAPEPPGLAGALPQ